MRQRFFFSSLVLCLLCVLCALACGGSMDVGGGGAGLAEFAGFSGPAIWGNLVLLALSVGIFVSTLGLRK